MSNKIFRSIITTAALVLLASFVIIIGVLYGYFTQVIEKQLREELDIAAAAVEEQGGEYIKRLHTGAVTVADGSIRPDGGNIRLTLISSTGEVIYDTKSDAQTMENHIDRREIRDAMNGGYGMSRRYSSTLTQKTIYCAKMLKDGSFLRISTESASVPALVLGMIQPMIFVAVIAVILSAVLAHRMAKRIVTPLNELNLDTPLENNETYPEISPLLTRIDVQHKKIERQIRELRRKNDELQQITESMNEALVMLDVNGCVLGINSAARQLFEVDNSCIGSDFLTVDRNPEFNRRIMNAFAGSNETFNLQKHGREYKVDISRVESGENLAGILLLAFDVTEQAETEKMRREFTANVSHELKTPLQSIMGSAELIENGLVKPEDMPHFIKNIRTESARLVALIEDIIRLSRLDEGVEIPKTEVDILNVATETAELLRGNAEAKNVSVKVHGRSAVVFGVDRLIYEIAYNLCENAVKYNIPGGTVDIGVDARKGKALLTVRDTGIGIPKEQQSRVFERFYRVDKSRSKDSGGTGLGLSIVKHAAAYHNAELTLESVPGKGTCVTVAFPLYDGSENAE